MTPATLQALRRFLHFSQPEAAELLAASADRPAGVQERTWRYWETGERPVPADIAARVRELVAWRDQALATSLATIRDARAGMAQGDELDGIDFRVFDSLAAWTSAGGEPALWRPHCAVAAALAAAEPSVVLVV